MSRNGSLSDVTSFRSQESDKDCAVDHDKKKALSALRRRFEYSVMDSPRSWAVAAACCWMNVFTLAMVRSAAVVFVGVLQTFNVSREEASWPVNLSSVCYFLTGPIAGVLARHIAMPKLTFVGSLAGSLAVSACFFATDVTYLIVFLGVIHGTGIGLLALFSVVINQHFEKYRAVASGIANAGFTIGGLLFPPFIQMLFEEYGIRGMFLLCGAVMLNSAAGTILFGAPRKTITAVSQSTSHEKAALYEAERLLHEATCTAAPNCADALTECQTRLQTVNIELEVSEAGCDCSHTKLSLNGRPAESPGCTLECEEIKDCKILLQEVPKPVVVSSNSRSTSLHKDPSPKPKSTHLLSFLILPKYYLISFSLALILNNMTTFMTVIVDFAKDKGVSNWDAVFLISSYTVADLVARLGSGWITDRGFLARSTMMATHFLFWGGSLCLLAICGSYHVQVLLSVLCGWCNGCTLILISVLFMELVGIDKLGVCFGIATTLAGLLGLLRPPLIGYYRDRNGDYQGLFTLMGGLSLFMSLLWLCFWTREKYAFQRKRNHLEVRLPESSLPKGDALATSS